MQQPLCNSMRRSHFGRLMGLFCLAVLLLSGSGQSALAQRISQNRLKGGAEFRRVFSSVVADVRHSLVRVRSNGANSSFGSIIDSNGLILTKASELKAPVTCILADGRELAAVITGVDPESDLAMLKVDATGLTPVALEAAGDPKLGSWLITPGQGDLPVAIGVMSVGRRNIAPERGVLGISIVEAELGPKVTRVFPNSGADEAGVEEGDVITRVADRAVKTGEALSETISRFRPGDSLALLIRRGEKEMEVRATLGYPLQDLFTRGNIQNQMGGKLSIRRAGFPAVLQHDTVLNPEDCGGPVLNLEGKVVGINIARAGRTESFALPMSEVVPLLEGFKTGKYAPKPVIVNTSADASESPSSKK